MFFLSFLVFIFFILVKTSALLVQKCELHIQVHYCIKTVQQNRKIKFKKRRNNPVCSSMWIMLRWWRNFLRYSACIPKSLSSNNFFFSIFSFSFCFLLPALKKHDLLETMIWLIYFCLNHLIFSKNKYLKACEDDVF